MRDTTALRQTIQLDTDSAIAQGEGSVFSPFVHLAAQLCRREARRMEERLLDSLEEAVDAGEVKTQDDLQQRTSEEIGSIFTYTLNASAYVFGCDNPDAYEDECGEKPATVEQQAAYALEFNVRELPLYATLLEAV